MRSFLQIIKDELSLILEDKSILLTCLLAPIFYAFFVGSIYKDKDVSDIPVAMVDLDHSSLSKKIGELVDSNQKIKVMGSYSNMEEALFLFNGLQVQGILIIPREFEKKTMNLEGSTVELILNNTKFLTSNDINKGVQQVMLTVAGGVRLNYLISSRIPTEMALEQAQPIMPVIKSVFNATNNYGDYLLPILLVLIIQQTLIIGFGQSVLHELVHYKTLSDSKINFFGFMKIMLAKSSYYVVLYASLFFLFYKVIFPYYHLDFKGSEFLHFSMSLAFILSVMVYTIFLSTFFKTAIGWTEIMAFSTYPLFLVSGYSWPIEAMPKVLQIFANLLPSTPYFTMFNKLSMQGASLINIKSEMAQLLFLLLFGYLSLYLRFRYIYKKRVIQVKSQ
ncbi:ABC transporter permease [Lutimonas saemankumensis]|uniref:ABC transporter permease n=1 Tax=Lutimonas saemankumensis TaxID=483016 RepID=UPI001CD6CE6F|nr:ABC transporter permease [Lutimonas saemankumensis]MCA0930920.1 ABC transporter permease [Lutimonas saemankumensis]